MDGINTPEPTLNPTIDELTALAEAAAGHPAVAPPLRALVPALVALVLEQKAVIDTLKG